MLTYTPNGYFSHADTYSQWISQCYINEYTYKHTPCGYLRTVTSAMTVDTNWNNRYGDDNCFHENVDYTRKSDF